MLAKDLMSIGLVVVPPDTPVTALAELLGAGEISAVPVVDASGTPCGIVTEGDLIRRLADKPPGAPGWFLHLFGASGPQLRQFARSRGAVARDVMTTDLVSLGEDATAEHIAQLMAAHGVRGVLVLREGRLVGLVSRADLLRAILRAPDRAAGVPDDAGILRALQAAMRAPPWVNTGWVYPDCAAGTVTLHGFARSDEMREGLLLLARAVPDVVAVEDRLEPMPALLRATF